MSEPLSDSEIATLRSIMRGLSAAEWRALKALAGVVAGNATGTAAASGTSSGAPRVATDYELSGQYGDPTVRKDPKRWAGASYAGARFSQCPTEYLLELASFLEWKADKESQKPEPKLHRNGTPYYEFDRKDARLARGWAERNRGKVMPPPAPVEVVDDSVIGGEAEFVDDGASGEWVP